MSIAVSPLGAFHRANALTYLSLLAGVTAVASATVGDPTATAALIAIAVVADTFDGAFARRFARTADETAFGAQLDSLSDAVAFGAAPAVSMAILVPDGHWTVETVWWLGVFAYTACAITRLAFYNLTSDVTPGFVGLPAPIAALLWASVLLLDPAPPVSAAVLLVAACGMVAPLGIPRPSGAGLAAFALWPMLIVVVHFV